MSEFYHIQKANRTNHDHGGGYSTAMQAFLDFNKANSIDLLYAQLRLDNVVVDEYLTHELKTRLNVFTVSEGVVGIAAGIAIDEGILTLDERLCDSFPEYVEGCSCDYLLAIRVRDLLTMTAGLEHPLFSCDDKERYTIKDWIRYFFDSRFVRMPGKVFLHSDFNTYMLSCLIEKKIGVNLLEYLRDRLFEPVGIGNPDWLLCPKGHIMGANGLYLTVEEMGRLGQLIIDRGMANTHRIVSEQFIEAATRKQVETSLLGNVGTNSTDSGYGYHFWISHVPNCVILKGRFGQGVVISLDKGAVLTFQALEGFKYEAMFDQGAEAMRLI